MITEKRIAKEGEKILITNAKNYHHYKNGDMFTVQKVFTNLNEEEGAVYVKEMEHGSIWPREYEVVVADDMAEDVYYPNFAAITPSVNDVMCNLGPIPGLTIEEEDPVEKLLEGILYIIESNNEKMKNEYEEGHDYAYLRYLQGKDVALRDIIEMIDAVKAD